MQWHHTWGRPCQYSCLDSLMRIMGAGRDHRSDQETGRGCWSLVLDFTLYMLYVMLYISPQADQMIVKLTQHYVFDQLIWSCQPTVCPGQLTSAAVKVGNVLKCLMRVREKAVKLDQVYLWPHISPHKYSYVVLVMFPSQYLPISPPPTVICYALTF